MKISSLLIVIIFILAIIELLFSLYNQYEIRNRLDLLIPSLSYILPLLSLLLLSLLWS